MGWSDGFRYTPSTSVHFLMGFHFPQRFFLPFVFKTKSWEIFVILEMNDAAFFLLKGGSGDAAGRGKGIALGPASRCAGVLGGDSLTLWSWSSIWPNSCCLFMSYSSCPQPLQPQPFHNTSCWGRWGKKGGFYSLCTHTLLFLWTACRSLASWEAALRVIKRAPELCVLGKCTGVSASGRFKIEGKIQMHFLLYFCEWWKGFICRQAFTLVEKLVFMLCFISICQLLPVLRCFAHP